MLFLGSDRAQEDSVGSGDYQPAEARATAFAFCTSVGRFIGAGVNFGLAGAVAAMGTLGTPIALTAATAIAS
jgi:hypothetical protein